MNKPKKSTKIKSINITIGILAQIYFLVPWLNSGTERYNALTYILKGNEIGFEQIFRATFLSGYTGDLPGGIAGGIKFTGQLFSVLMGLLLFLQILVFIYTVASCLGYQWTKILTISVWILGIMLAFFYYQTLEGASSLLESKGLSIPMYIYGYFLIFVVGGFIWIMLIKMTEQWDEASKRAKEERIYRKLDKQERKRRLAFSGKYCSLYYRILWKDLSYRKKEFLFLLLAEFLCAVFLFTGGGVYCILSAGYGEDFGMLGMGLVEIVLNFIVVSSIVSIFLLTVIFSFYRKNRMANIGLYETLGMRKKALAVLWGGEIFLSIIFVLGMTGLWGNVLLWVLRKVLEKQLSEIANLGYMKVGAQIVVLLGIVLLILLAEGMSRDVGKVNISLDARNSSVRSEKLPGRLRYLGATVAGGVMLLCVIGFSQRRMAESIWIFAIFLVALAVCFYNGWIIFLQHKKQNQKKYLKELSRLHILFHKYKTLVLNLSLLAMIHICVLVFFGAKFISSQIATDPEELFPYDYVCLANTGDFHYFDKIEEEFSAEIYEFPMVRVTTVDGTEAPNEYRLPIHPQGQHIGISESTYQELKMLKGEKVPESLELDADGNNIYVVYQQDQAAKAKPVDWYLWTQTPYLHIGNPVLACNRYDRKEVYPPRTVIGEETGSLIGTLRQGRYEDIIVFSDEYFEKIKDIWKETSIITGKRLTEGETRDESIEESATCLYLLQVPEEYKKPVREILEEFRKQYNSEEKYDPLVRRVYDKDELVSQRNMERRMEILLNGFVEIMLLLVSLFLVHMRVKLDLPDMTKRYLFMERLGMRQKERIRYEKQEISRYLYVPFVLAAPVVIIFTCILFKLRMFNTNDIQRYLIHFVPLVAGYIFIQILNIKWIEYAAIKRIEVMK